VFQLITDNSEKITNKKISDLSGLSEITVKRHRKKNVSPSPDTLNQNVSLVVKNVSPVIESIRENVSPVSDAFKHFLKRKRI
jgi:hypothetical protein